MTTEPNAQQIAREALEEIDAMIALYNRDPDAYPKGENALAHDIEDVSVPALRRIAALPGPSAPEPVSGKWRSKYNVGGFREWVVIEPSEITMAPDATTTGCGVVMRLSRAELLRDFEKVSE